MLSAFAVAMFSSFSAVVVANDVAVELYYDGAWHDIVPDGDVLVRSQIVITRGQGSESPAPRPCTITCSLANDDDRYRTSNPESPLYGKAGRNTPMRVLVGGNGRGIGELSSSKVGQSSDFRRYPPRGTAWADIEAGGLLRRINGWTETLKSPFRQYNETITQAVGYFPMEQARGSTVLESTVPGTVADGFSGMAFDSQYRPPSSRPLMDVGEDAELGQFFAPAGVASSTAGWQLSWVGRYEPLLAGGSSIMYWKTTDTTAWGLELNPTTGQMNISAAKDGAAVVNYSASYSSYDWTQWTMFSIDAAYSGGTTTVYVNWTNADNTQSGYISTTYSGVTSSLSWWSVTGISGDIPAGSTMGHLIGVNVDHAGGVDLFGSGRKYAWSGYLTERAAVRFGQLCDLKGIPYVASSGYGNGKQMGPRPAVTLAEMFREIAATDDALIYDHRTELKLYYLSHPDRENQTPALTLYADSSAGMPNLPEEVTDDLETSNIVTISQRDGGEYTLSLDSGALSTQAPPDGVGEARQTVDVNIYQPDVNLPLLAGYWLSRGTVDLPRYPRVTVNLAAVDAATLASVESVDVGDVIEIVGYREYTIRLWVLGYTETIGWPIARKITFTCSPDQPFDVGILDTDVADSGDTVLKDAVNASATSVTFRTTSLGNVWNTTTPYDVMIAGQRQTVTSMGAASLVSGAYDQAATVIRGVDGIRKDLAANEPITVVRALRCAL